MPASKMKRTRHPKHVAVGPHIHVFVKPAWKWELPLFIFVMLWGAYGGYVFLPRLTTGSKWLAVVQTQIIHFWRLGYTPTRLLPIVLLVSLLLLVLIYRARSRIAITRDALIFQTPLGEPKVLRWVDVDEVYIRRIHYPLEGRERERRIMILYARPLRWWPFRRRFILTNWQLEGYREAEHLAVKIAVPAIAERCRAKLLREGGTVEFGRPTFFEDLQAVLFSGVAVASGILAVRFGRQMLVEAMALFWVIAVIALLGAVRHIRRRWYAVDPENLYVHRRGLKTLKIPLSWLSEARVVRGVMTLSATPPTPGAKQMTLRDKRYFRNRGVMLALIRLLVRDAAIRSQYQSSAVRVIAPSTSQREQQNEPTVAETAASSMAPQQVSEPGNAEDAKPVLSEEIDG